MKSAHRHELETNALAKRLDEYIERFRPYASTIAGIIVAIVLIMFAWSYFAGSSSARQSQAWDAYHQAVEARLDSRHTAEQSLRLLRESAQEYPGTKMQETADIAWADGQVWLASMDYIYNRAAAKERLTLATSAYQAILQSTDNERLANRARIGLARVYEMQNELDKARDEYGKVKGSFEQFAKLQLERLAEDDAKQTYAWLATAQPPRPATPSGPGKPGERPEFSAGDISLPTTGPDTDAPGRPTEQGPSFDNILQGLEELTTEETPSRYEADTQPATESQPEGTTPPATEAPQPTDGKSDDATE